MTDFSGLVKENRLTNLFSHSLAMTGFFGLVKENRLTNLDVPTTDFASFKVTYFVHYVIFVELAVTVTRYL